MIVEDKSVPDFELDTLPTEDNSIAIDLGLEKLYVDSLGNQVLPQKYLRSAEEKLAKLQRKLAQGNRGRKAKKLIQRAIAKLHQKSSRARKQWHFEEAKKLCQKADVIAIEDLKISNLRRKNKAKKVNGKYIENGQCRKAGLNKSFSDCAMAQFVDTLHHQAQKLGVRILKINPKNTSQTCPVCLSKVSKTLSERWHNCPACKAFMDRDYASALLIKKVALGIVSL